MKIKITSGYQGVISTGSFQNERPNIQVEAEFEVPETHQNGKLPDFIKEKHKELSDVCYSEFKQFEHRAIIERVNRERQDIRFYGEFPSVTSIIGWDSDFFCSSEDLAQYASQGSLIHAQVENYIKTGKWEEAKDIEGTWSDLVIVKKGKLGLAVNGWSFPDFLEKYPLEDMRVGEVVISKKHKFGGTPDFICKQDGKKTLADVKRTADAPKNFKQISAYILALEEMGESQFEQAMVVPLNNKTKQGFSKPLIIGRKEIIQYQKMFLQDREKFQKRFGI